ncbi:hypothetical protein JXB11_02790 [Candidatus Woesearchaeota archaeon]|nr:hypothetical protein [Candidatus Woesearchaeota archaeon]
MGVVLSTKLKGEEQVVFEVLMPYEESVQLQGHMEEVHIFSENVKDSKTKISARGKNGATKYFLVPRELRDGINLSKEVNCQKIELKDKVIFIYSVDKF